ncbi:MAG: DNA-binding transcriptional regulator [Phycisphaerales bacterium]
MADKRKKVALIIEAIRGHEREVVLGIANYARVSGNWVFYLDKLDPYYHFNPTQVRHYIAQLMDWGVEGVITRYPEEFALLKKKGIPMVSVKQARTGENTFAINNEHIGIMGAKYFLEKCFKHYGFCGFEDMFWSDIRCTAFSKVIKDNGCSISIYGPSKKRMSFSWEKAQKMLAEWLVSLPKPVAVMACNDDCAEHVLEAAKFAGLYVPEDVAVLGVSNDELICEFSDPPLSSIILNGQQAGYEAAALLDNLMAGIQPVDSVINVKPIEVVGRRSTDFLAVEDKTIAEVLAYIRRNSTDIIQVEKIAEQVGVSLRVLQSRFRQVMGFTLREELNRARLNRINALLLDTKRSIEQIADMTGYSTTYNMIRFFQKQMGTSPGQYRKLHSGKVIICTNKSVFLKGN